MIVTVASGKGGTGTTTVAAALAHLGSQELPVALADAECNAANLELELEATKLEEHEFWAGRRAFIDPERCTARSICATVCRFDAVRPPSQAAFGYAYQVDALSCEGCASCFSPCPADAIRIEGQRAGQWFPSDSRFGALFRAHHFAGQ